MGLNDQQRPVGTGDHGETWDPVQKRWVPQSQMPAQGDPASGNQPTDISGTPLVSNRWADANGNPNIHPGDDTTPGRVQSGPSNGGNVGSSWGGYSGTVVKNPDGSLRYDAGLNGQQADVDRLRGFANTSAKAPAYQINYGDANGDNMNQGRDRTRQDDAISIAQLQASGAETPAQALAKQTLQQGGQGQIAAAMSTRGGPLAQVGAVAQQQEGASIYQQKGANQIAALRADEMQQGRNTLAGLTADQRAGDIASQYNNASQAINQGAIEGQQRDLNQKGQLGYEQMGSNVNAAAQSQAVTQREQAAGVASANLANSQKQADQNLDTANAIGQSEKNTITAGMGDGGGSGKPSGGVPMSDMRVKRKVDIADYLGRK